MEPSIFPSHPSTDSIKGLTCNSSLACLGLGRVCAFLGLALAADGLEAQVQTLRPDRRPILGEYQDVITRVDHLTVDGQGRVWVAQPVEALVRVISLQGEVVRVVGGRGNGPGEFMYPRWLGSLGDSVWVSDPQQDRVALFDPEGKLLRTERAAVAHDLPGVLPHRPGLLMHDGSAWSPGEALSEALADHDVVVLPLARLDLAGGTARTVTTLRAEHVMGHISFGTSGGVYFDQPWARRDLWALRPDGRGLAVVKPYEQPSTRQVELTLWAASGASERSHTIEIPPAEGRLDIDGWIDRQMAVWSALPAWMPRIRRPDVLQALYVPDSAPSVFDLLVGPDDEAWLSVGPRSEDGAGEQEWLAFSSGGRLLRRVVLPGGVDVKWIGRDIIVAIEYDEFDIPTIVAFQLGP